MCVHFSRIVIQLFVCALAIDVERAGVNGVVGTGDKIIPQEEHFGICGSK